jgi:tripartite-type tricarboxylate transporter receptor subunit TctC
MNRIIGLAAAVVVALNLGSSATAQTVEEFYRGKTIDLYIGFTVGGGYDLYARLVGRFLGEHIPGRPRIVPKQMTGAGSRVLTNFMYSVAPKDGTALATVDQSIALEQAIGDPGIQFDASKFAWIGNPSADNNTTAAWYTTGVKTIEDAKTKEIIVGATGNNTSSQYPMVMNQMVGTKFKIIMGYPGGADINLAMEKGEVGARGSNSWEGWKSTKPEWVRDKKLNILVQIGLTKAADLQDVPLLMDLAKSEDDRAALRLLSAPATIGRPLFATPGTPPERVAALRQAFEATMKDPAFLEAARQAGLAVNPVSGEALQKIVGDIIGAPQAVKERLAGIVGVSTRPR